MTALTLKSRVRLKDPDQYRDIGTQSGTVVDIVDASLRVRWDVLVWVTAIKRDELEAVGDVA